MKHLLTILFLGLTPTVAAAGDPCPIPITIRDLGTPAWLDRDEVLGQLQTQMAWIGIRHYDVEDGIVLSNVHPASPAAQAGLKEGDVIIALNDIPTIDVAAREALFDAARPGDRLIFTRLEQPNATLTVGHTDPVTLGITRALERRDCRAPRYERVTAEDAADILPMLFHANRSFRCEDAHLALQELGERFEITDIYFVRGSRRVLITMPYWGTTCISNDALDGENYTAAQLLAAADSVSAAYIQDRFDNP
ncbi:PDZ domain-containing protein [Yoonia sp. BS5-3]|uniref:PDZ domain-containing protein n=1 Tax=Yoonia phaeophyticola TaxID=3137369 RepID=A0ABZ2V1F3_9RHOB